MKNKVNRAQNSMANSSIAKHIPTCSSQFVQVNEGEAVMKLDLIISTRTRQKWKKKF